MKKRDGQWLLKFVCTESNVNDNEFHYLCDEVLIVEKLNSALNLNLVGIDQFKGLQLSASLSTVRMLIHTNFSLTIQLDSVKLTDTQFVTIGTYLVHQKNDKISLRNLGNICTLLESKVIARTCSSKIIQYHQLLGKLRDLQIMGKYIQLDKSQLMDRFLISMPITRDQRILMIEQLASEYDDMYDHTSSEDG